MLSAHRTYVWDQRAEDRVYLGCRGGDVRGDILEMAVEEGFCREDEDEEGSESLDGPSGSEGAARDIHGEVEGHGGFIQDEPGHGGGGHDCLR